MARRIAHILESSAAAAGSTALVLPGLFDFQRERGWQVAVISGEHQHGAACAIGEADLVHLHDVSGKTIKAAWDVIRRTRQRYIVSTYAALMPRPHSPLDWRKRLQAWTYRRALLRRAWCLHALTETESDYLKRQHYNKRVKVLPLGIHAAPPAWVPPPQAPARFAGKRVVLFLGRLHPSEGIIPLLKASSMIADEFPDVHLVLAGPAQAHWTRVIRAGVQRHGFQERATVIAEPSAEHIGSLLAEAALVVVPVPGACCPVSALQAMICGKPVLLSPGCHLPHVPARNAGWIADPNRKALQHALREILALEPAELAAIGSRGTHIIADRYAWDRLGPEYLNLYARAME